MRTEARLFPNPIVIFAIFAANAVIISASVAIMPYWITAVLIIPAIVSTILFWPNASEYEGNFIVRLLCSYIVIFSIWPQFSAYKIPGLPAIEPQRILCATLLLTWSILLFTNRTARHLFIERIRIGKFPIACLLALYSTHFLVVLFNKDPLWSFFLAFRELTSIALVFAIPFLAVRNNADTSKLFSCITFGAAIVSIMAIIESLLKHNLFSSWVPISTGYAEWATAERVRDGSYRVQATFDSPLLLVDYLVLVWPVALYTASNKLSQAMRIIGVTTSVLVPVALLRTGSRAALLVISIETIFILMLWIRKASRNRKAGGFPYFVAIALFLSVLFAPLLLSNIKTYAGGRSSEEAMSTYARTVMVSRAIDDIGQGNIFGHGFGRSPSVIGIKTGPPGAWIYVLDNYFVTIALDSGLLALICYCSYWFWLLKNSLRTALSLSDEPSRIASTVFLSTCGFIIVKAISSQTQVFPLFYIITGTLIPLLHSLENSNRS